MKPIGSDLWIIFDILTCAAWFGWWKKSWQAGIFLMYLLTLITATLDIIIPLFLVKP